jgi:hypothetical protein
MSSNRPKLYKIDGEELTLREIGERLPGLKKSTLRSRVVDYGWRTWAELRQTTKLGARSPWRGYKENWLSGGDRAVLGHYRENGR